MQTIDPIDLARTYWVSRNGEISGPFTLSELGRMGVSGALNPFDQFCEDGTQEWSPYAEIRRQWPEAFSLPTSRPATVRPAMPSGPSAVPSDVSRLGYLLLAIFFGTLGFHNFYARETDQGFTKLGLFLAAVILLTIGVVLVPNLIVLAIAIWALVEGLTGPGHFQK